MIYYFFDGYIYNAVKSVFIEINFCKRLIDTH